MLQDGRRVITRAAVAGALGISGGSAAPWTVDGESALGRLGGPIRFRTPGRQTFIGYDAERLPEVCDLFLHGRKLGTLTVGQERVASRAEMLVRGFAQVGIVALVDEASGYQEHRAHGALALLLEGYVAESARMSLRGLPDRAYQAIGDLSECSQGMDVPAVGARVEDMVRRGPRSDDPGWAEFAGSVTTLLVVSDSWDEFDQSLDRHHPRK